VKPAIDVIGQRGGQAVASLFILSQLALGRGDVVMAVFVAVLCVAWIAAIAELRPHYVEMFRRALREGLIEARGGLPELDLVSLETLFTSLNSRDDGEVIAALDLLHAEGRTHLVPALILYHPTPAVVLRALELFEAASRTDFMPVADRLLDHTDAEVRAAALRVRASVEPDEGRLRGALADPSPLVRATALAGLLAETSSEDDARPLLEVILAERAPEARRALARAIQQKPVPAFAPVLDALATDPQDEVQVAVARSIGALREKSFLPTLLEQLRREAVRSEAQRAFQEFGPDGLQFLERALEDATLPQELRRHIPRAIAGFPAADAVAVLQRHLLSERDGMVRYRVHRALGRVATRHPEVDLDEALLTTAAGRTVEAISRLAHWLSVLELGGEADPNRVTPGHQMLVALLRDKAENAEERLFRLLDLIHREENFRRIYRGLRSPDRRVQASSRELLENVVRPPLKGAVLAIVDGVSGPAFRLATASFYEPPALSYEDLVTRLVETPGETLRSLAVFHVGELGLHHLRPRIAELRSQETSLFVGQMFDRSLRVLERDGGSTHAS
jgi:HEAT repeat protein